jgi:hypothetical protein
MTRAILSRTPSLLPTWPKTSLEPAPPFYYGTDVQYDKLPVRCNHRTGRSPCSLTFRSKSLAPLSLRTIPLTRAKNARKKSNPLSHQPLGLATTVLSDDAKGMEKRKQFPPAQHRWGKDHSSQQPPRRNRTHRNWKFSKLLTNKTAYPSERCPAPPASPPSGLAVAIGPPRLPNPVMT